MELIYFGNSIVYKQGEKAIKYIIYPDDIDQLFKEAEISHEASKVVLTPQVHSYTRYYTPKLIEYNGKEYEAYAKIVTQYVEGITLDDYLQEKLSKSSRIALCKNIISIVKTLHSNNITHDDLWPVNWQIDSSKRLWLMDWGASSISTETQFDIDTVKIVVAAIYYDANWSSLSNIGANLGKFTQASTLEDLEELLS